MESASDGDDDEDQPADEERERGQGDADAAGLEEADLDADLAGRLRHDEESTAVVAVSITGRSMPIAPAAVTRSATRPDFRNPGSGPSLSHTYEAANTTSAIVLSNVLSSRGPRITGACL